MRKIETTDEQIAKFTALAVGAVLGQMTIAPNAQELTDMKDSILRDMDRDFPESKPFSSTVDKAFQGYIDLFTSQLN